MPPGSTWASERIATGTPPELNLTPRAARLFLLLHDQLGSWVHEHAIIRALYGGYASKTAITSLVHVTRRQLERNGTRWRIENKWRFASYRLVDVEHEAANAEPVDDDARGAA